MKKALLITAQALTTTGALLSGWYVIVYGFAALVNGSDFHAWTIPAFLLVTVAAFIMSVINNFLFEKWRRERNQLQRQGHFKKPGRFEQRLQEMERQRESN